MSGEDIQDLPSVPKESNGQLYDDCRLWIGNVDSKLTEFSLLKVFQKFGDLQKFDYLYHKSGPDAGKPRGYCFVSYSSKEEATKARKGLHGKLALSRRLVVRQAYAETRDNNDKGEPKPAPENLNKNCQIQAIEAKLKNMSKSEDLTSFKPKTAVPISHTASVASTSKSSKGSRSGDHCPSRNSASHRHKPYSKSSNRSR